MNRRDFVRLSSLALAGLGIVGSKKVLANSPRNLPPPLITDDLVASWSFSEGWNSWVFNRVGASVYPVPANYIGAFSEQLTQTLDSPTVLWNNATSTITDFQGPDPNGGNAASRIVMGGGSSQATYYTATLAAVQYTLSVYVKSNTGLSQNFRMGNASAPGSDKTATTSWTRFSETFTPSAGSVLVGILNDTAHDPMDVLVYGFKLELGASPTTYQIPAGDLQLGKELFPPTNVPTWDGTGLIHGASVYTHGILETPLTFTNISCYGVFKKTGADSSGVFEPVLTSGSETSPPYGIIMESRDFLNAGTSANSVGPCFGFGFTNPRIVNASGIVQDGAYHVFCGTYDGTNIKLYWDGTQVAQKALTIPAQTVHRFFTGIFQSVTGATNYFPGTIGMLALYDVAHTVTEVRQNTEAMFGDMACRSIVMAQPTKFIGVEGDSIPAGLGITQAQRWSWLLANAITPTIPQWNDAVGGSTVATCAARAGVFNQALNPNTPFNLFIIELGANDLAGSTSAATFVADLKQYCLDQYTAGWSHIAVVPVLNRGDIVGFDAKRTSANSLIAGDPSFYDVFITLDPIIMAAAAVNDPTLFQTDKVHPTAFSNLTYLYPGVLAGITPLIP